MIQATYEDTADRMDKTITACKHELSKIRTGRASLNLLDNVKVDYYGTLTPLNQVAALAVPESRLITIKPWELSILKEIEKAILKSDLGLNPSNDGKIIRISIPVLTEQRRKELVKVINKICEEYRVGIRNIRRDSNEVIKGLKKDGDIAEDQAFKAQEQIQKITDEHIKKVDDLYKEKEKEILEL
ncbi:MAG: ribosome recycling factor [Desulfobacteraceae bacterium]|nr:ribosome recycling factor [Desulfobacteraceae bacterium]MBU4052822.1 ribosome recycling factor [Pseudomonadota bacterium]